MTTEKFIVVCCEERDIKLLNDGKSFDYAEDAFQCMIKDILACACENEIHFDDDEIEEIESGDFVKSGIEINGVEAYFNLSDMNIDWKILSIKF